MQERHEHAAGMGAEPVNLLAGLLGHAAHEALAPANQGPITQLNGRNGAGQTAACQECHTGTETQPGPGAEGASGATGGLWRGGWGEGRTRGNTAPGPGAP